MFTIKPDYCNNMLLSSVCAALAHLSDCIQSIFKWIFFSFSKCTRERAVSHGILCIRLPKWLPTGWQTVRIWTALFRNKSVKIFHEKCYKERLTEYWPFSKHQMTKVSVRCWPKNTHSLNLIEWHFRFTSLLRI